MGAKVIPPYDQYRMRPNVLWSHNSKHAILINTALPLTKAANIRGDMSYVVDYSVTTNRWSLLEPLEAVFDSVTRPAQRVKRVGWLVEGEDLLVEHEALGGRPLNGTAYRLAGEKWVSRVVPSNRTSKLRTTAPLELQSGLNVFVRETANSLPIVVASNGKNEVPLLESDEAVEGLWRAPVQTVEWIEKDGRTVSGGLILPRDWEVEKRPIPLVIQASHYWDTGLFRPDGTASTAYAAQGLAARGMAVLQVEFTAVDRPEIAGTPAEGIAFVERIDAAVTALTAKGWIDPSRVGLIGFSRGGLMTYYAITHPGRTKLAAAISGDGGIATYAGYLLHGLMSPSGSARSQAEIRQMNGGSFWLNKAAWLEYEPSFNVDRVETPFLCALNGPATDNTFHFDLVTAFRENHKPLEMIFFPKGDHQLQRPHERAASMSATIDWMAFWLKGDAPKESERAARWVNLRQMQDEVLKAPRPAKGKWIFVPDT